MSVAPPPARTYTPPTPASLNIKPATTPAEKAEGKQPGRIRNIILGEAILGSILILAAPFLGEFVEPVGGAKGLAVLLAVAHYAIHLVGGAVLFKAGLDWGRHSH